MISQYWFRYWLGAVRQQAITWTNVDWVPCRLYGVARAQWVNERVHWSLFVEGMVRNLQKCNGHTCQASSKYSVLTPWHALVSLFVLLQENVYLSTKWTHFETIIKRCPIYRSNCREQPGPISSNQRSSQWQLFIYPGNGFIGGDQIMVIWN